MLNKNQMLTLLCILDIIVYPDKNVLHCVKLKIIIYYIFYIL